MKLNRFVTGALIVAALCIAQSANAQGFGFFRGSCANGVCQRGGFGLFRGRVASYGYSAYQSSYSGYGACANGSCFTGGGTRGACVDGACKINSLAQEAKSDEYIPVPPCDSVGPCEATTNAPEPCNPVTTAGPEPCEPVQTNPEPCEPVQTVQPCAPVQTNPEPCESVQTTCEGYEQTTQTYTYGASGACPTGACPTGACPLRVAKNAAKAVVARTFETLALARINATRAMYGRPALRLNRTLETRAYYQAQYCASVGTLRHAGGVAEILAQSSSFDGAIGQWLRSAPHCALMLNTNYTEAGAAYYTDAYGRVWCAVQFR